MRSSLFIMMLALLLVVWESTASEDSINNGLEKLEGARGSGSSSSTGGGGALVLTNGPKGCSGAEVGTAIRSSVPGASGTEGNTDGRTVSHKDLQPLPYNAVGTTAANIADNLPEGKINTLDADGAVRGSGEFSDRTKPHSSFGYHSAATNGLGQNTGPSVAGDRGNTVNARTDSGTNDGETGDKHADAGGGVQGSSSSSSSATSGTNFTANARTASTSSLFRVSVSVSSLAGSRTNNPGTGGGGAGSGSSSVPGSPTGAEDNSVSAAPAGAGTGLTGEKDEKTNNNQGKIGVTQDTVNGGGLPTTSNAPPKSKRQQEEGGSPKGTAVVS